MIGSLRRQFQRQRQLIINEDLDADPSRPRICEKRHTGVRQKVTAPSQGAELDGKAETVAAAATSLDLDHIFIREQEIFPQSVFCNIIRQVILRLADGWQCRRRGRYHTGVDENRAYVLAPPSARI